MSSFFNNSALPVPNSTILGTKDFEYSDWTEKLKLYHSVVSVFDGGVIFRRYDKKLAIEYLSGDTVVLNTDCSGAFENVTYVSASNFLFYTERDANSDHFICIVDLSTGLLAEKHYIGRRLGTFLSMAENVQSSALIFYFSKVSIGESVPITSVDFTNLTFTTTQSLVATVDNVCVAFRGSAAGVSSVKAHNGVGISTFSALNTIYQASPAGSSVISTNASFCNYLLLASNKIFCMNQTSTQIRVYDAASIDVALSTSTVDTRIALSSGLSKVYYPRLRLQEDANIVRDVRTHYTVDLSTLSAIADFSVCINETIRFNLVDLNLVSDDQSLRVLGGAGSRCFFYYELGADFYLMHANAGCYLNDNRLTSITYSTTIQSSPKTYIAPDNLVGLYEGKVITSTGDILYADETHILSSLSSTVRVKNYSDATLSTTNLGGTIRAFSYVENGLRHCLVRGANGALRFTEGNTTSTITAASASFIQQIFKSGNKVYLTSSFSPTLEVFSVSGTLSVTQFNTTYSRLSKVQIAPNEFTGELFLYDSDYPLELRRLNYDLENLADFTNRTYYTAANRTTLITDSWADLGNVRASASSTYELYFVSESEILFINNATDEVQSSYKFYSQATASLPPSNIVKLNNQLFTKTFVCYSHSCLIGKKDLTITPFTSLKRENNLTQAFGTLATAFFVSESYFIDETKAFSTAGGGVAGSVSGSHYLYDISGRRERGANIAALADYLVFVDGTDVCQIAAIEVVEHTKQNIQLKAREDALMNNVSKLVSSRTATLFYDFASVLVLSEAKLETLLTLWNKQQLLINDSDNFEMLFKAQNGDIFNVLFTSFKWAWEFKDHYKVELTFEGYKI